SSRSPNTTALHSFPHDALPISCELGRIHSDGQPAKAARGVRIGDMLRVTNDGGDFQVEVMLLSEVRGPATVAQTLYRETEASREDRKSTRLNSSHRTISYAVFC